MLPLLSSILPIGEKLIERLIPDKDAQRKAKLKLASLEKEGQLKEIEMIMADRDSARARETAIATSENASWLNKCVTPILALGTVAMSFALLSNSTL